MLDLDPSDDRPLYVQIMDEIRRGVVLGTWRADEALPSVRQMASELRVNPNTVAQAYRELEREGVVYVQRGQGTFINGKEQTSERSSLLAVIAERATREAYRSGFTTDELIAALERHVQETSGGTRDRSGA